jgi:hypothetical protein
LAWSDGYLSFNLKMGSMKGKDLLLLGGAALALYYFSRPKQPANDLLGNASGALGNIAGQLATAAGQTGQGIQETINGVIAGATNQGVAMGGSVNQYLNAGAYQNLSPEVANVVSNVDFLNQISGAQLVTATIAPTASGSGLIQLRGASGVPTVQSQALINTAVRSAPVSYGVTLASGGSNVFNITSAGKPATTAFMSVAPAKATAKPTYTSSYANLASRYARGF